MLGERADQRVGGHHAADQVVGEPLLDDLAEGTLDQAAPQSPGRRPRTSSRCRGSGSRKVGATRWRPWRHLRVEAPPGVVLRRPRRSARGRTRGRARPRRARRAGRGAAVRARWGSTTPSARERSSTPSSRSRAMLLGQQRDQVGVPRQPGRQAGEGLRADRGAADVVQALQDQHRETGSGQVGRGGEAVVTAADDHDVVLRARGGASCSPWATGYRRRRRAGRNIERSTIVGRPAPDRRCCDARSDR